jgi:hypothetical protein
MGFSWAKSIQVISSPKYLSSWGMNTHSVLADLHALVTHQLRSLSYGPMQAVCTLFHHNIAKSISQSGNEFALASVSPAKKGKTAA